jgi:hypothetical protein
VRRKQLQSLLNEVVRGVQLGTAVVALQVRGVLTVQGATPTANAHGKHGLRHLRTAVVHCACESVG